MTSAFMTQPNIFSHQLGLRVRTFCNYSLGLPSGMAVTYCTRELSGLRI